MKTNLSANGTFIPHQPVFDPRKFKEIINY